MAHIAKKGKVNTSKRLEEPTDSDSGRIFDDDSDSDSDLKVAAPQPKKRKKYKQKNKSDESKKSQYAGVYWQKLHAKWRGITSDVLANRSKSNAKTNNAKLLYTKGFDDEHECYQALQALQKQIDDENNAIWAEQASKDPLTSNVERAPDDIREAEKGTAYWKPNQNNNQLPTRMVVAENKSQKAGFAWKLCCQHLSNVDGLGDCCSMANSSPPDGKSRFCISHGGGCVHGRLFNTCNECCPLGKYSRLCRNCNCIISVKRALSKGGPGICSKCESNFKSKAAENGASQEEVKKMFKGVKTEDLVFDTLAPLIVDSETGERIPYEMRDDFKHMLGSDKRRNRGQCNTEHQRRPDLMFVVRSKTTNRILAFVFIEVDEECHEVRTTDCELGKMDDTFQACATLAQEEGKARLAKFSKDHEHIPLVYTFKFNPDAAGMGTKVRFPLKERVQVLASKVNSLLNKPDSYFTETLSEEDRCVPWFELLYYKPDNKHLLEFQRRKEAGWDWKFLGNSHPKKVADSSASSASASSASTSASLGSTDEDDDE